MESQSNNGMECSLDKEGSVRSVSEVSSGLMTLLVNELRVSTMITRLGEYEASCVTAVTVSLSDDSGRPTS